MTSRRFAKCQPRLQIQRTFSRPRLYIALSAIPTLTRRSRRMNPSQQILRMARPSITTCPSPAQKVSLEILDAQGHIVRKFSNTDKPEISDEDLEKQLIPVYWVRPHRTLSTETGMHRWIWDLHFTAPSVDSP